MSVAHAAVPKRVARLEHAHAPEAFSIAENDDSIDLTVFGISDGDLHVGMQQIAMMSEKGTVGQCSNPACDRVESSETASARSCMTAADKSAYEGIGIEAVYAALDVCREPLSVRMVGSHARQHEVPVEVDIVLDSGADASALPLAWREIGEPVGTTKVDYGIVDAQDNNRYVHTVRTAECV